MFAAFAEMPIAVICLAIVVALVALNLVAAVEFPPLLVNALALTVLLAVIVRSLLEQR